MKFTGFENTSTHSITVYLRGGIIRRFSNVEGLSVDLGIMSFIYGVDGPSRSVWFDLSEIAGIETIGLENDIE